MSGIGWMVAALVLGSGAARADVQLRHGADVLLSDVGLEVSANGDSDAPAVAWRQQGEVVVGTLHGVFVDATLRLAPVGGSVELDVELTYATTVAIDHEVVHLRLPGAARAIGRDLAFSALDDPLRVGPGTPVVVTTPRLAIIGGEGLAAARYTPRAGHVDVELILDDRAAHPFSVYDRCLDRLPSPPDWSVLERRHPLDRVTRTAGARVAAHVTLYPLDDRREALPLVVERWPAGAKAAVVFTDHADRTDPAALRAVMYGSSAERGGEPRGFVGHGLRLTKTFFARGGHGTLADDAAVRSLADALVAGGSEVGDHSTTAHADVRGRVAAGLGVFAPWHPATWIDHEPYTNCEAISSRGWSDAPPYGIRDLLIAGGYRWLWAATDVKSGELDLFSAESPVIFPLPLDPRLWVFRSTWFAAPPVALAHALREEALDDLERRRGLAVLHTYLSASPATTPSAEQRRMLVVRPTADDALEIDPAFDAVLARLATHAAAGRLVVAPWRAVGDRLRALGDVGVRYARDGSAAIENRGPSAIPALTISVPRGGVDLVVDRVPAVGRRAEPDRTTIWFDLAPGARATIRATDSGAAVPFLRMADVVVQGR